MKKFIIIIVLVFVVFKGYCYYKDNYVVLKSENKNITKEQIGQYSVGLVFSDELNAVNVASAVVPKDKYPLTSNEFSKFFAKFLGYSSNKNSVRITYDDGKYSTYTFNLDGKCQNITACYVTVNTVSGATAKIPLTVRNGKITTVKNYNWNELKNMIQAIKNQK